MTENVEYLLNEIINICSDNNMPFSLNFDNEKGCWFKVGINDTFKKFSINILPQELRKLLQWLNYNYKK